jgi:hypothetical protein
MQYHQQTGVNDCAPACLAMVASHYRSYVSIGEIRKFCKTDSMGTSLAGLIAAAEKLGFNAKAFKGEKTDKTLDAKIIFPFIAQIKIQYLGNTAVCRYSHQIFMAVLMNSPPLSPLIPLKGDEEGSADIPQGFPDPAMSLVLQRPFLGPLAAALVKR